MIQANIRNNRIDNNWYYQLIHTGKVLDYSTIRITIKDLYKVGCRTVASKLEYSLKNSLVINPDMTAAPINPIISFYRIDLDSHEINVITSMFKDFENSALGVQNEPTVSAAFYASIIERWEKLQD